MVGVPEDCDRVILEGPSTTDEVIQSILNRPGLRVVELKNCDRITDLSPLENILTLEEIHLFNCRNIRCLGNVGQCYPALRRIVLSDTPITGAQVNEINSTKVELVALNKGIYDVPVQSLVKSSLDIIREIYLKYDPQRIGIAYNGGKDCIAMIDLLFCVFGADALRKCCTFILCTADPSRELPEVRAFREQYAQARDLTIATSTSSVSMKASLVRLKEARGLEAVFMGTRRSDQTNQRASVEPTSAGWPPMTRVCPLFEWSYADVWGYIRGYGVPFCPLYARGFTSIGDAGSTFPNPALRKEDGSFRPAWELTDPALERAGREEKL